MLGSGKVGQWSGALFGVVGRAQKSAIGRVPTQHVKPCVKRGKNEAAGLPPEARDLGSAPGGAPGVAVLSIEATAGL